MTEPSPTSPGVRIDRLPGTFAICRLPTGSPVPTLPATGEVHLHVYSITVTPREISIVCPEADAPAGADVDGGWSALYLAGPMPFDLAGVLVSVLAPLSAAGLGVFALSTFDSDLVLVRSATIERAIALLTEAGHTVRA